RSETLFALYDEEENTLVGVSGEAAHYGLIVDIGTTTVAALMLDLDTRRVVASRGEHNAEAPFGADVISRIQQSMEQGVAPLQQAIVRQIDELCASLCTECGCTDVSLISITGNTTMLHLLCGLPATNISRAPFIPVTTEAMRCNAASLGLHSQATTFLLPGISAYIGADTVASLLAAAGHTTGERPFLLVDFGTNAETVLFANGTYYACSAAAGPCFEGATLACGMAGQHGAIDTVLARPATPGASHAGFAVTVIGGGTARGVCGSGVVDAIALLLDSGDLDETGRLEGSLTTEDESGTRFQLTDKVYLSQKDIREVQLAKAAVRAGIEVLLTEAGLLANDVQTLFLAGGFGSAIRPESAVRIGLVPEELKHRVQVLGNAACFGALRAVTETAATVLTSTILRTTRYIELSAHPGFCDTYVENMLFPQGA
ncbi:MAG: ASKHA domain-containing protein, partial [Bilophila sp.]